MKKILSIIMIMVLIFNISAINVFAVDDKPINIIVNGSIVEKMDVEPFVENNRTLVPVRAIAEKMGAEVFWDDTTQTVTINKLNERITYEGKEYFNCTTNAKLVIEQNLITIGLTDANGKQVFSTVKEMDTAAKIVSGRTFIPARFVGYALGYDVSWEDKPGMASKVIYNFIGKQTIDKISTGATVGEKINVDKNDIIIRIKSAKEIHALSRILVSNKVYVYKFKPFSYNIEDDFNLLGVPKSLKTKEEKMDYIQTASYMLMDNISIDFKYEKGLDYFLGIGSVEHPFKGNFYGNNKTITLASPSNITLADGTVNLDYGFFAVTKGANISDLNIEIKDNIIIDRVQQKYVISFGSLVGNSTSTNYDNCNVKISNATFGVDYGDGEGIEYISQSYVGGLVGRTRLSTYNDCHVELIDSSIIAKAKNHPASASYSAFAVGGLIGLVGAGSNNTAADIGVLGDRVYNCSVVSNNATLRDVILAEVESGDEMTAGGLVGMAYNNPLISGSSVDITNGNIIGQKTGNIKTTTSSGLGSTVGGIIGRMEHTGEIIDCTVSGNNLHILAKSPHRVSWAGGIVGESIGAHHRNTIDVVNCHFDGSENSTIEVNVAIPDETIHNDAFAGGIAGSARRIEKSTVKNVTIINNSTSSGTKLIGHIVGKVLEVGSAYVERVPKGIYDSSYSNIILEKGNNVIDNNYEIN